MGAKRIQGAVQLAKESIIQKFQKWSESLTQEMADNAGTKVEEIKINVLSDSYNGDKKVIVTTVIKWVFSDESKSN